MQKGILGQMGRPPWVAPAEIGVWWNDIQTVRISTVVAHEDLMTLAEAFPKFLPELRALLERAGRGGIASQVGQLYLASRCGCGDSFCSTFYVKGCSSPLSAEEQRHRGRHASDSVDLDADTGLVVIDTDHLDRLTQVEVLNRPDVETELTTAMQRLRRAL